MDHSSAIEESDSGTRDGFPGFSSSRSICRAAGQVGRSQSDGHRADWGHLIPWASPSGATSGTPQVVLYRNQPCVIEEHELQGHKRLCSRPRRLHPGSRRNNPGPDDSHPQQPFRPLRLNRILPERVARFQADFLRGKFTTEDSEGHRGRRQRSGKKLRRQNRGWTRMYADRIGVGNRLDSCPLDARSGDCDRCLHALTPI